ncbi:Uncharacterised protein [Mycobacteroides abscessus subsp. massiliense]|nr:Uncharacterised protein [Mycobacteroides abscessus subsp. massiliense]
MKLGGAVKAMFVTSAGGYPQRAIRGCDPGAVVRRHRDDTGGGIHDLMHLVPVAVDALPTAQRHHSGEVAANQHKTRFYRKSAAWEIIALILRGIAT